MMKKRWGLLVMLAASGCSTMDAARNPCFEGDNYAGVKVWQHDSEVVLMLPPLGFLLTPLVAADFALTVAADTVKVPLNAGYAKTEDYAYIKAHCSAPSVTFCGCDSDFSPANISQAERRKRFERVFIQPKAPPPYLQRQ